MAFADGELDVRIAASTADVIASNANVRRRYAIYRDTRNTLGEAFNGVLVEPLPERLLRAVAGAGA